MRQMRKMGPLEQILKLIPGLGNSEALKGMQIDESHLAQIEGMILSMTPGERRDPAPDQRQPAAADRGGQRAHAYRM